MYVLHVSTIIRAKPERCFDLARSVDLHIKSATKTGENAVAGRTAGMLEMADEVTWEGRHFGLVQRLTSRITAYDRPRYFQDRMVKGAFKFLEHDHRFEPTADGEATEMIDVLRFEAPLWPMAWLIERLILARHLRKFLEERGRFLKEVAESSA